MLSESLTSRVLQRLGVDDVTRDHAGLARVYAAWCARVPFDNLQKRIWLRERSGAMPGDDPARFFEDWLAHGTGGTCWGSSGALHALLVSLGFRARRIVGAMMLGGGPPAPERRATHGTVCCDAEGRTFLLDTHVLHRAPLPFAIGQRSEVGGVSWARVEPEGESLRLHFEALGGSAGVSCLLEPAEVDDAFCTARHLRSETDSGFNATTFARRGDGDGVVVLSSKGVHRARPGGTSLEPVTDRPARDAVLRELGYSAEIVARLPDEG